MKLTFLGAAHEVTGSCHMLEACGKIMLVDCGMEQGPDIYENQEIPVDAARIDYVFLTHAHIDHSGLLPLLYKRGFRGSIFTTYATWDLCDIMLRDSAHIQESDAAWENQKGRRAGKRSPRPPRRKKQANNRKTLPLFPKSAISFSGKCCLFPGKAAGLFPGRGRPPCGRLGGSS